MPLKYLIPCFFALTINFIQPATAQSAGNGRVYNITGFGALGDGRTNSTAAIQRAIDAAGKSGGGLVEVPAGKFLTAVIHLQSGVNLHLAKGAFLLGSTKRTDYGKGNASALIVARNLHRVSITGRGTIDGQAAELLKDIFRMLNAGTLQDPDWKTENPWHQKRPTESNRPKLLDFENCTDVSVSGITLQHAATWVQGYKECRHLVIDSVRVESTAYWNNDGMDVVDCSDVRITNCSINASDDGICLKSENANSRCENISITHCRVRSSASAIKLGTASLGGFRNIRIKDIEVYDTYRSAIALESVDGGTVDSVFITGIRARNTGNAIFIRLGHRNKKGAIGRLRHIFIKDVQVTVPAGKPDKGYEMEGPALDFPHHVFPASITGLPGHPVQDVYLKNIKIRYEGEGKNKIPYAGLDSLPGITENASGYPEFPMFGELPAWGLYVRHAEGLYMKNIRLEHTKESFRAACVFDEVNKLDIAGLHIDSRQSLPAIVLNKVKNHFLKDLQLPTGIKDPVLQQ